MRKPPEVCSLGVWSKQTRLRGVGGEWERDSWGNQVSNPPLCFVYIISQHDILYASQVESTLFSFELFGGRKYSKIDSSRVRCAPSRERMRQQKSHVSDVLCRQDIDKEK